MQKFSFFTFIKNNSRGASYFKYYKPYLLLILMLIKTSFTLNKLCILGIALKEQFLKNLQRFAKARNKNFFLATKISSLILTLKHKQTALILHKKASILKRII